MRTERRADELADRAVPGPLPEGDLVWVRVGIDRAETGTVGRAGRPPGTGRLR